MSTATDQFVETSKDRFLEELKSFLRIPSISTLPEHRATQDLQHKWLFSRESLEQAAHACGFSKVQFAPHHDHGSLYRDFSLTQLRSLVPDEAELLPGWAHDILDSFDRALPPPVKRLLMLEGTVILTK